MRLFLTVVLIAAALTLAACGVNVNVDETGQLQISVDLAAETINQIAGGELTIDGRAIMTIDRVEFRDSVVRLVGVASDSGTGAPTSFVDLQFSNPGGDLLVQVVAMDLSGRELDAAALEELNQQLTQAFALAASTAEGVEFTTVNVRSDGVRFVIRIVPDTPQGGG
jgi:hypothetical protein